MTEKEENQNGGSETQEKNEKAEAEADKILQNYKGRPELSNAEVLQNIFSSNRPIIRRRLR